MTHLRQNLFAGLVVIAVLAVGAFIFKALRTESAGIPESSIERLFTSEATSVNSRVDRMISAARERIKRYPRNAVGYVTFASATLLKARETGDPQLYTSAEIAAGRALELDPGNTEAMLSMGSILLSRHRFSEALEWGNRAVQRDPYSAAAYGIIGDAYAELGEYDKAVEAVQQMVDLRPDSRSYARGSHLRELHGDIEGAIAAMVRAVRAVAVGSEDEKWATVQLGNLYLNSGRLAEAEATFQKAIGEPPYPFALAGLARVRAADRRYDEAIILYEHAIELLPEHAFVEGLGEVYLAAGRSDEAAHCFSEVRDLLLLDEKYGMNIDLELGVLDAERGLNLDEALNRARREYNRRPRSVKASETLAWVLYKAGNFRDAWMHINAALRLGTADAALHFRAALIAKANDRHVEATRLADRALEINPYVSHYDAFKALKGATHTSSDVVQTTFGD